MNKPNKPATNSASLSTDIRRRHIRKFSRIRMHNQGQACKPSAILKMAILKQSLDELHNHTTILQQYPQSRQY
eukprot:491576-Pelagomonas_calceolata.AAC.1